ncbi:hypothetical protein [Nitrincola alkalisediminis]|uniref:hypothetical protein n=1 Tax=Nitrincola alkalisediminis TaxID=1366656 RepID=UPI00187684F5|nr:hypothetical protein [Nitrincola alkalisediminis]
MSSYTHTVSLEQLRTMIRQAQCPDDPLLIYRWFSLENEALPDHHKEKFAHYEQQFRLLLETLADEVLPAQWRIFCLENINRPLLAMKRLPRFKGSYRTLNRLQYELHITFEYIRAGLYFNAHIGED